MNNYNNTNNNIKKIYKTCENRQPLKFIISNLDNFMISMLKLMIINKTISRLNNNTLNNFMTIFNYRNSNNKINNNKSNNRMRLINNQYLLNNKYSNNQIKPKIYLKNRMNKIKKYNKERENLVPRSPMLK